MRQELTALQVFDDGSTTVNPEAFSHWLTQPRNEPKPAAQNTQPQSRLNAAEATVDQRLGTISHLTLQPENRQWIGAAWPASRRPE